MKQDTVVIVGAGPAGLTAAFELSQNKNLNIIVIEADMQIGGISKTVDYKGNLIDIGGHRFFSKSKKVLSWWTKFQTIMDTTNHQEITYHNQNVDLDELISETAEKSILIRPRKSRIYFTKKFFEYPLKLNLELIQNLGKKKSLRIMRDIVKAQLNPIKPENNLEDFYINRFGSELYRTFFKDYTKKVWGKDCTEISSEWGRQRVKSLNFYQVILHSVRSSIGINGTNERSLIEKFLYPAKGPGQLWEAVKDECEKNGVQFLLNAKVNKITIKNNKVSAVHYDYDYDSSQKEIPCNALFSSMPLKHLFRYISPAVPKSVGTIAEKLDYRDFIIVGLLLSDSSLTDDHDKNIDDNWLYIQDSSVQVGRLQFFHNWSPFMTKDGNIWIGAEYFCTKEDALWKLADDQIIDLAINELDSIGIIKKEHFLEGTVVRCPKAYPSYTGEYSNINVLQDYLETIYNIFPIGRNGLHKYNNQDHSMLTAFKAVELFLANTISKKEIWDINSDNEYHEEETTRRKSIKKVA